MNQTAEGQSNDIFFYNFARVVLQVTGFTQPHPTLNLDSDYHIFGGPFFSEFTLVARPLHMNIILINRVAILRFGK